MGITGPACFGFERGWLSKALKHIPNTPDLFQKDALEDAQYLLGMGNRQVLALEYWLRSLGLMAKDESGKAHLTDLGKVVLQYDPQIEEKGTWFALHYRLSAAREVASTYWYASNCMTERFDREKLIEGLKTEFPGKSLRTYQDAASIFFSILAKTPLGSIVFSIADDLTSRITDPPSLPDPILLFALVDWCGLRHRTGFSLMEFVTEGAPGRVFGLSDATIRAFLDTVQDRYRKRALWWSQTSGLDSVAVEQDLPSLAILRAYYLEHLEGLSPVEALRSGVEQEDDGR